MKPKAAKKDRKPFTRPPTLSETLLVLRFSNYERWLEAMEVLHSP